MDWGVNPERVASSILLTVEKPAAWRRERTGRGGDTTLSGLLVLLMREPRVGPPGGQETAVQPWAEGCNPFGIDQNVQTPISSKGGDWSLDIFRVTQS